MTPSHPDVDVVIATRHRPAMLREAVSAVAAQTYPGTIRCLVVHDGTPPDQALRVPDGRRPVTVVANRCAPGLAGARNTGVRHGSGRLVAFCDDDDLWAADKIERQVGLLHREAAAAVVTGITVVHGDRRVTRVPRPDELTAATLARRRVMAAHPSTVLVERTALEDDIGLFDEAIPGSYGEDYDWILRAIASGPVAVVEAPLVDVRWGSSQFSRQWRTIADALDYLVAKHPVLRADRRALGRISGQRAFALAALHEGGAASAVARCLRLAPTEPRGYLAAAVALRLVSADRVLHTVNRRGRGI